MELAVANKLLVNLIGKKLEIGFPLQMPLELW